MNKFIYLFAILGLLALSTAQIVEPVVSNAATDSAEEAGILTPFEDYLPVDGDSDYFKNGEDYGGIYEGYLEDAEGFVSTADDINEDFGSVEDPIVAEEFAGLVDVPEPLNEEDATIGETVFEPSEDLFQFNQIPNDALDSAVGEDFYESGEGIVDSPDDIISEEGFVGLPDALIDFEEEGFVGVPDALIDFEEEAIVDEPEALVDLEEAVVGEPEALIDVEEGKTGSSDDEFGEVGYPDDLIESVEDDFSEALVDYPDDPVESDEDFSEAFVDYPDNLAEAGEDVSEALVDYPDDYLIEESSEAFVDSPDDLFDSEGVTVDISEGYVGKPEDITDVGEVDEPEDPKEDESEDITDAGEVDKPEDPKGDESEDITDAGEVDKPEDPKGDESEDITDAGEVDKPEDPKEDGEVELDPRVLDTNEEESTTGNGQGYAVQLDGVEQAEEKSKNFLG